MSDKPKTLVVYYSLEGNTKMIAEAIADASGGDTLELVPYQQPFQGPLKYLSGVKQLVWNKRPSLQPYHLNVDKYDLIFIGYPVWAGTFAPPVKSFLEAHDLAHKSLALFCSHKGQGAKSLEKLKAMLPQESRILANKDFPESSKKDDINKKQTATEWATHVIEDYTATSVYE